MPILTWWLWEFGQVNVPVWNGSIPGLCSWIKAMTPAPWRPGIQIKAHSGPRWQGDFDHHPLAVTNQSKLVELRDGFVAEGVAFSVWGEPRGPAPGGGSLAGQAGVVAGYYCADVEPFSDFDLDPAPEYAEAFWQAFRDSGGGECGVSLVPLPSGLDPFNAAGLRAWLRPVRYVEPQCYWTTNGDLAPDVAVPFLRDRIRTARSRAKRVVPILPRNAPDWQTQLCPRRWRYGMSVWRL